MEFINSYKHLEKLCNEIYGGNHGISAYIDDMSKLTSASYYVSSWDDDLKQLKHYRWIRNKIVHDPNCTEENMCEYEDAKWLDNFYSRVISRTDPLALYYKIRNSQVAQKPKQTESPEYVYPEYKAATSKPTGCLTYLAGTLFIIIVIALAVTAL